MSDILLRIGQWLHLVFVALFSGWILLGVPGIVPLPPLDWDEARYV